MRQILFSIPFSALHSGLPDVPIYGYGLMLFCAFIATSWLAARMSRRERIEPRLVVDMAIWLFIGGIAGARTVYVIQYWHTFENRPWTDVFRLWDGGLVFYGAIFGAVPTYFIYHWFMLRKHQVSHWRMLDVVAPCIAIGLAFGRVGCLFTGCCYGNIACDQCPAIHFPLESMPTNEMLRRGLQTPLGFITRRDDSFAVEVVEPGSAAERAGVQPGDVILAINEMPIINHANVREALEKMRETHQSEIRLRVSRGGAPVSLPPYVPTSIGLNPTQIYETISMLLVLFLLLSYYPFKRHNGELMVILMFCYGVHRFLNEMLRTDTDPVAFGLTLSQNISLLVLALGAVLAVLVWRRPLNADDPPPSSDASPGGEVLRTPGMAPS